jgi:hypothetical protein
MYYKQDNSNILSRSTKGMLFFYHPEKPADLFGLNYGPSRLGYIAGGLMCEEAGIGRYMVIGVEQRHGHLQCS